MKMSACFTQLCSRAGAAGGEAAVLEQDADPYADGVIAEGTGWSPVGASTSRVPEASRMKYQCHGAGNRQGFCRSFAAKCSANTIPLPQRAC